MADAVERIVMGGFDREQQADEECKALSKKAIVEGIAGLSYFVRKANGRWAVFERRVAKKTHFGTAEGRAPKRQGGRW